MFIINKIKNKNLSGFPVLNTHISSILNPKANPFLNRVVFFSTSPLIKSNIYQSYFSNKLPIAYSIEEYGKILIDHNDYALISLSNNTSIFINKNIIDGKPCYHIKYFKNSKLIFEWIDKLIEPNYLIREIGKSIYHFKDYSLVLHNISRNIIKSPDIFKIPSLILNNVNPLINKNIINYANYSTNLEKDLWLKYYIDRKIMLPSKNYEFYFPYFCPIHHNLVTSNSVVL